MLIGVKTRNKYITVLYCIARQLINSFQFVSRDYTPIKCIMYNVQIHTSTYSYIKIKICGCFSFNISLPTLDFF